MPKAGGTHVPSAVIALALWVGASTAPAPLVAPALHQFQGSDIVSGFTSSGHSALPARVASTTESM